MEDELTANDKAILQGIADIQSNIVTVRNLLWKFPNDERYTKVFLEMNATDKRIKKLESLLIGTKGKK
jgi:hypothetical protein